MTKSPNAIPFRPATADRFPPGEALVRAAAAVFAAKAHGSSWEAETVLEERAAQADEVTRAVLTRVAPDLIRSPSSAATTAGSGWADVLAANEVGAFLASLAPYSAASVLFAGGMRVTLPRASVTLPRRAAGPQAVNWVGEGKPIAVRDGTLDAVTVGPVKKVGAIVVLSREVGKLLNATAFGMMLREDAGASLDAAYFSADSATSDVAAGLLDGLTAMTPTAGVWFEAGAAREDLAALAAVVGAGGSGQVVFVMSTGRAAKAGVLVPDLRPSILGSSAVADDRIIAVDPLALVHSASPQPVIEVAEEAVLHMEDTSPAEIVSAGPTTASPVASLWQTGSLALRMILEVCFAKRTANAVAFMDGVH